MWRFAFAGFVAMSLGVAAFAQPGIDAEGVANGTTVLWFAGTAVTLLVRSDLEVAGTLTIEDRTVSFEAIGEAVGHGCGDSAAMTIDAWILMNAVGATSEGEPLAIRGGMTGSSTDADLASSALGSADGPFFFVVTIGPRDYFAKGEGRGTAAGTFVVPDDPFTMQMEGTATYALVGELSADADAAETSEPARFLEQLPWDRASWPADLLERLLALLAGAPLDEATSVPACDPPTS